MLLVYSLVLLIGLSSTYGIFVANSKYLWLNSSYQSQSLLNDRGASSQANIGLYKILFQRILRTDIFCLFNIFSSYFI